MKREHENITLTQTIRVHSPLSESVEQAILPRVWSGKLTAALRFPTVTKTSHFVPMYSTRFLFLYILFASFLYFELFLFSIHTCIQVHRLIWLTRIEKQWMITVCLCLSQFQAYISIFNNVNIYWFVLRKYQSRERNFHLRITLTQQNPKILVHIWKVLFTDRSWKLVKITI